MLVESVNIMIATIKSMWKQFEDREISRTVYKNWCAKKNGYDDYNEYEKERRHNEGICQSMSENKECAQYLGIHKSERYLSKIWDNVIRMPNGNRGYDFICGKGFKVDVKSACIMNEKSISTDGCENQYYKWYFNINKNKITDYFLLLAFDNREDLNPLHIWLIKNDEIINDGKLNDKKGLHIYNSFKSIQKYKKYELVDRLEKLKNCLSGW